MTYSDSIEETTPKEKPNLVSMDDIVSKINLEAITMDEIRKSIRQLRKRKRKIHYGKKGYQNLWLMTVVTPIKMDSEECFWDWLISTMEFLLPKMPNSAYKAIVAYLGNIENAKHHLNSKINRQAFEVVEGHSISILPSLGIVAFHAPPGNLKRSFNYYEVASVWNWSIGTSLFSDLKLSDAIDYNPDDFEENTSFEKIHKKYGKGKNTTIAVLDSGICLASSEVSNQVIWQGEILPIKNTKDYKINRVKSDFHPLSNHGTQVASLLAGKSIGVAPEANIISFVVPKFAAKKFDLYGVLVVLEEINNDRGVLLDGSPLRAVIDVLLLPLGIISKYKIAIDLKRNIQNLLMRLHDEYDINIIAAIGNESGEMAFPSTFPFVHSVGYLTVEGRRHPKSGYGIISSTGVLPNSSINGENLITQGRDNKYHLESGSSLASSIVAGYFGLLKRDYKTAEARLTCINNATNIVADDRGDLRILNPNELP